MARYEATNLYTSSVGQTEFAVSDAGLVPVNWWCKSCFSTPKVTRNSATDRLPLFSALSRIEAEVRKLGRDRYYCSLSKRTLHISLLNLLSEYLSPDSLLDSSTAENQYPWKDMA